MPAPVPTCWVGQTKQRAVTERATASTAGYCASPLLVGPGGSGPVTFEEPGPIRGCDAGPCPVVLGSLLHGPLVRPLAGVVFGCQRSRSTTSGEEVTRTHESDLIERNYTHGPVDLGLIVNLANRQATLKVKVFGEITATATVQEGRPMDKIISDKLPGDVVTLRLEAHKVSISGTVESQPVDHEIALP
jgi:hypothetical protein